MKALREIVFAIVFALVGLASVSNAAMSADDHKMMMMHDKMAKMHTMAAKCMKSGKSDEACHEMMMKDCKMGEEKCKKMMSMMDDSMSKMTADGMMDDGMMKKDN